MYCPNCGKEIENDAQFCEFCGAALTKEAQNSTIKGFKLDENVDFETAIKELTGEKQNRIPGIIKIVVPVLAGIILLIVIRGVIISRSNADSEGYVTYSSNSDNVSTEHESAYHSKYLIDDASLFTSDEYEKIASKLQKINDSNNLDIVILTKEDVGNDIGKFADDYYDNNGFRDDGLLLVLCMKSREWYISTTGRCIDLFPDSQIDSLMNKPVSYLGEGDYYKGFDAFLDMIEADLN